MKLSYKNAVGLFSSMFIAGVVTMAAASFLRAFAFSGTLQTVGILLLAGGIVIYLRAWRCPACRELLPKQITVPPNCPACGKELESS